LRAKCPKKTFRLPLRFRMTDAQNDLLRKLRIHKDGLQLAPPTGKPNDLYLFPLVASVRDADGRQARMRISGESAEKVEFVNRCSGSGTSGRNGT
jgi:hypothetical protein